MTKEQAINKIEKVQPIYLNDDQKKIAKKIIESVSQGEDVLNYFDFIMKRSDVGFKFDVAPEIATGRIAVVNEMNHLNININNNVETNENKLIIGDNYEALKNLLLTHKEKIDVIYIDPPYNTEKSKEDGNVSAKEGTSSKFVYKDKFGRNGWLNMLRDRLVLAKRLLSNEGVIFISIDDTEQAYLKVLMDDIFGDDNFVNQLIWISNKKGRQISNSAFAKTYEYILMYSKKQVKDFTKYKLDKKFAQKLMPCIYENKELDIMQDKIGNFIIQNELHNTNINGFNDNNRPNLFFPIFTNGIKISTKPKNDYQKILPPKNAKGIQGVWRWSKQKIESQSYDLYVKKHKDKYKIFTKIRNLKYTPKDIILSSKITTKSGSNELQNIGINNFLFPKPSSLIEYLLNFASEKSLILDFFAGSGTTGHVVMNLNKQDGGDRKFILVTNNENNIAINITYERLYRIIKGKTTKNKKHFKWIDKNEPFSGVPLRVFNIKHFNVETNQSEKLEHITSFAIQNLKKLNPNYKPSQLQAYYDLDGLNPLNEAQRKQVYSTDKIIHEPSSLLVDVKKYCTCGKSFENKEQLKKHIKKENN